MVRQRFRCPVCRVIFPSAGYNCLGGWPVYDPASTDEYDPPHERTPVVPDPDTALRLHA